jgi:hypothetical protein
MRAKIQEGREITLPRRCRKKSSLHTELYWAYCRWTWGDVPSGFLGYHLYKEAPHWSAIKREKMAELFKRWADQLWRSIKLKPGKLTSEELEPVLAKHVAEWKKDGRIKRDNMATLYNNWSKSLTESAKLMRMRLN